MYEGSFDPPQRERNHRRRMGGALLRRKGDLQVCEDGSESVLLQKGGVVVVLFQCRCEELAFPLAFPQSAPVGFTHRNSRQIEKRQESVASAPQTSLLLMNYSRAHFRGNEILNGLWRTSSAECVAELRKVIDSNGKSAVELMKREKNPQLTWSRRRRGGAEVRR